MKMLILFLRCFDDTQLFLNISIPFFFTSLELIYCTLPWPPLKVRKKRRVPVYSHLFLTRFWTSQLMSMK